VRMQSFTFVLGDCKDFGDCRDPGIIQDCLRKLEYCDEVLYFL